MVLSFSERWHDRSAIGLAARSLAKGLRIIEAFTAETPRLIISEGAAIAGLDRATTRRCLLTLAEQGYCAYDGKFLP